MMDFKLSPGWEIVNEIPANWDGMRVGVHQPSRDSIPIHNGTAWISNTVFHRLQEYQEDAFWREKFKGRMQRRLIDGKWYLEWYASIGENPTIERRPITIVPDVWYDDIKARFHQELYPWKATITP